MKIDNRTLRKLNRSDVGNAHIIAEDRYWPLVADGATLTVTKADIGRVVSVKNNRLHITKARKK